MMYYDHCRNSKRKRALLISFEYPVSNRISLLYRLSSSSTSNVFLNKKNFADLCASKKLEYKLDNEKFFHCILVLLHRDVIEILTRGAPNFFFFFLCLKWCILMTETFLFREARVKNAHIICKNEIRLKWRFRG